MAVTGAIAAVAAVGATVYQGEKQASTQKKALRSQEQAQRESTASAAAQQRRAEQESAMANRKRPNVDSLLATEKGAASKGMSSTMLTGNTGVGRSTMKLGTTSMLGG